MIRHNIKFDGYSCPHDDRGWMGIYTHLELGAALDRGYRVRYISWAWYWDKWSDQLFKEYVRTFMKIKVECEWEANDSEVQELVVGKNLFTKTFCFRLS